MGVRIFLLFLPLLATAQFVFEPAATRIPTTGSQIAVADFNRDGRQDLAFTAASEIQVWLSPAAPNRPPDIVTLPLPSPASSGLAVLDWDGDQRPDLAAAIFSPPQPGGSPVNGTRVVILQNRDSGPARVALNIVGQYPVGNSGDLGLPALFAADVNRDSRPDLLALGITSGLTPLLSSGPAYTVAASTPLSGPAADGAPGDFNADGVPDIAVAIPGGRLLILTGRTDGRYTIAQTISVAPSVQRVRQGDLNRDGRPDLVIWSGSQVLIYSGQPNAAFAGPEPLGAAGPVTDAAIADFDGDGWLDLAIAQGVVTIVRRTAAGWDAPALLAGIASTQLTTGDFDGDGKVDLFTRSVNSPDARIYLRITGALTRLEARPVRNLVYGDSADVELRVIALTALPDLYEAGTMRVRIAALPNTPQTELGTFPLELVRPALPVAAGGPLPALVARTSVRVTANEAGSLALILNYSGAQGLARIAEEMLSVPVGRRTPRIQYRALPTAGAYEVTVDSGGRADLAIPTGIVHGVVEGRRVATAQLTGGTAQLSLPPGSTAILFDYEGDRYYANAGTTVAPGVSTEARVINAASGVPAVAAGAIASVFAAEIATRITAAPELPLPLELDEVRVQLRDRTGATHPAPLFFVSPSQINFLVPENVAAGPAGIDLLRGGMLLRRGLLTVDPVAPGIFTALGNGSGPPAAFVLRVRADGSREETLAFVCPAAGNCSPAPIRFSDTTAVVLTLYGTGLRAAAPATTARVGDVAVPVLFAGPHAGTPGLDQVNVELPRALAGRGPVTLVLDVLGARSNPVQLLLE